MVCPEPPFLESALTVETETLETKRKKAAEKAWEESSLDGIEDCDSWQSDSTFWSRRVYWENPEGGSSIVGSYGVEFKPGTAEIVNEWSQ